MINIPKLKTKLKKYPAIKRTIHWMLIPKNQARPRLWVKLFINPFFHVKGRGAKICKNCRIDTLPNNKFKVGAYSTIEDFSTINNGVGAVTIGSHSRIGIGSTVIGPVKIGDNVLIAQSVILCGMSHNFHNLGHVPINQSHYNTSSVTINNDVWIGANSSILPGVTIEAHAIVGAGSVVTKSVKSGTMVAGNPAKPIKQYNFKKREWVKVKAAPSYEMGYN